MCVCVVYIYVCVCVCKRAREEKERERERERESVCVCERAREKEIERECQRERKRHRERMGEKGRECKNTAGVIIWLPPINADMASSILTCVYGGMWCVTSPFMVCDVTRSWRQTLLPTPFPTSWIKCTRSFVSSRLTWGFLSWRLNEVCQTATSLTFNI